MTKKHIHTAKIPTRWGDMDAFNHINNAVFFTYFEQARLEWWSSLGLESRNIEVGPVVVTASCEFLRQLFHPANLIVKVCVGPPGRSSYMIYYEIEREDEPGVLYARGETKAVWVDYAKGKSVALPEGILKHLA